MRLSTKPPSPTAKAPLVVLVPPLLMPKQGMWPLERALRAAGRRTFLFGYPSYRDDIPGNARRLARSLGSLAEEPLDIVTFSLGGVLLRWAMNNEQVPALRRVVMIGPPNQGAWMADWADAHLGPLYPWMFGAAARQLRTGSRGLCVGAGRQAAGTLPPEELVAGLPASVWLELDAADPARVLAEDRRPFVVLWPAASFLLQAPEDRTGWQVVADRMMPMAATRTYPRLNHGFVPIVGEPTFANTLEPGYVAEALVLDVASFVTLGQLTPAKP